MKSSTCFKLSVFTSGRANLTFPTLRNNGVKCAPLADVPVGDIDRYIFRLKAYFVILLTLLCG